MAAQILKDATTSEITGEIVSVFPNSLYIKAAKDELIFVTSRQLRSPITLNVDSTTNFTQIVRPQDRVSLREGEICLGESLSVNLSRATRFSTQTASHVHELAITEPTLYLASRILMIIDNDQSVLDQAGLAHVGVSRFVSDGVLPFRSSNDVNLVRDAALRIVGLGTGFTPSGDDLLGGFLATYNSFTHLTGRQTIHLEIDSLEIKTNWVSAKLLDYMQRQILDEEVSKLMCSSASQGSDFTLALETLLSRGHTSGIDILVGVLLALGLIHDITRKTDVTTVIVKNLRLLA
jgi:hypothetical protein